MYKLARLHHELWLKQVRVNFILDEYLNTVREEIEKNNLAIATILLTQMVLKIMTIINEVIEIRDSFINIYFPVKKPILLLPAPKYV